MQQGQPLHGLPFHKHFLHNTGSPQAAFHHLHLFRNTELLLYPGKANSHPGCNTPCSSKPVMLTYMLTILHCAQPKYHLIGCTRNPAILVSMLWRQHQQTAQSHGSCESCFMHASLPIACLLLMNTLSSPDRNCRCCVAGVVVCSHEGEQANCNCHDHKPPSCPGA